MRNLTLPERAIRFGRSPIPVLLGVAGTVIALALAINRWSYDIWAAFWVAPVLLALTVPIASVTAKRTGDPSLGRLLLLAFAVRVVGGSVFRFLLVSGIYGDGADADIYDKAGKVLAPLFRDGVYEDLGKISGTRFLEVLTGQIYAVIGPTQLGGFLVYSWFALLGAWLLCRAFEIAVPDGDHRRYRYLVLFFPTMVFWPAGTGKDAWMLLCLGLLAYGAARLLTNQLVGLIPGAAGLWGAVVVRPHIALLFVVGSVAAAVGAQVLRRERGPDRSSRLTGLLVAGLLVLGAGVVLDRAESYLSIDTLNPDSAESVLTNVADRTGTGGSEFTSPDPTNPAGYLLSVVTVLIRPLPVEVRNGQMAAASAEGMLLLIVIWRSLGRLGRIPSLAARRPYVLGAVLYVLGFCYAFSAIDNFGILARQRAQLLPFLFVLLALPARPARVPSTEPA